MMRNIALMGLALLCSACAFGDETLTLAPDGETMRPGLLSEAVATRVSLADVVNGREGINPVGKEDHKAAMQGTFVGYKKNGYGQNTGNIISHEPVDDIVEAALVEMLELNGHTVGDNGALRMETTLTDFDLEYKVGFAAIEFIGSVEADVKIVNSGTGEEVYAGSFRGNETRKQAAGLSGTWADVLNKALADMVRQISLSPEVKEAFDNAGDDAGVAVNVGS